MTGGLHYFMAHLWEWHGVVPLHASRSEVDEGMNQLDKRLFLRATSKFQKPFGAKTALDGLEVIIANRFALVEAFKM